MNSVQAKYPIQNPRFFREISESRWENSEKLAEKQGK